jgi:hypothetical protein
MAETDKKQTIKGRFAPGNSIGKQFPKGVSGNVRGRPKITRLTEALREQLAETLPNAPEHTVAEVIAQKLIKEAFKGNVQAIREIGDRTEGKPKQSIDLDMNVMDWRQMAEANGITEADVINEAKLLLAESGIDSGS